MGVEGLTSYVDSHQELWGKYDLSGEPLVIDGSGLFYSLYRSLDSRYGGQYSEMKENIVSFFEILTSNDVTPYVIFDGLDISDRKSDTYFTRQNERIGKAHSLWRNTTNRRTTIIPVLVKSMFMKVLQENNICYAVADFEADQEIASLANELKAPVMGLDSDFFIFNITHGYIPYDRYDSGSTMVERYKCDRLASHLNISPSMLPILASLVGNDYVSQEILSSFTAIPSARGAGRIDPVARYLSSFGSNNEAMSALSRFRKLKEAVTLSVEEYKIKPTHLYGYFMEGSLDSELVTYNGRQLPPWLIRIVRSQYLDISIGVLCQRKVFFKIHVEDMAEPPAEECTRQLRDYLYKLLLKYDGDCPQGKEIVEYGRNDFSYGKKKFQLLDVGDVIATSMIPQLSEKIASEEARGHILKALSCDSKMIRNIPLDWQLVTAALRFWITNSTPEEHHVVALLVYFVGTGNTSMQANMVPQHAFSQWQQVILWVDQLNSVFRNGFPSLELAKLYDGRRVCELYKMLNDDGTQAVEDRYVNDCQLYQQIKNAVLSDRR